jgi:hypothetical protein
MFYFVSNIPPSYSTSWDYAYSDGINIAVGPFLVTLAQGSSVVVKNRVKTPGWYYRTIGPTGPDFPTIGVGPNTQSCGTGALSYIIDTQIINVNHLAQTLVTGVPCQCSYVNYLLTGNLDESNITSIGTSLPNSLPYGIYQYSGFGNNNPYGASPSLFAGCFYNTPTIPPDPSGNFVEVSYGQYPFANWVIASDLTPVTDGLFGPKKSCKTQKIGNIGDETWYSLFPTSAAAGPYQYAYNSYIGTGVDRSNLVMKVSPDTSGTPVWDFFVFPQYTAWRGVKKIGNIYYFFGMDYFDTPFYGELVVWSSPDCISWTQFPAIKADYFFFDESNTAYIFSSATWQVLSSSDYNNWTVRTDLLVSGNPPSWPFIRPVGIKNGYYVGIGELPTTGSPTQSGIGMYGYEIDSSAGFNLYTSSDCQSWTLAGNFPISSSGIDDFWNFDFAWNWTPTQFTYGGNTIYDNSQYQIVGHLPPLIGKHCNGVLILDYYCSGVLGTLVQSKDGLNWGGFPIASFSSISTITNTDIRPTGITICGSGNLFNYTSNGYWQLIDGVGTWITATPFGPNYNNGLVSVIKDANGYFSQIASPFNIGEYIYDNNINYVPGTGVTIAFDSLGVVFEDNQTLVPPVGVLVPTISLNGVTAATVQTQGALGWIPVVNLPIVGNTIDISVIKLSNIEYETSSYCFFLNVSVENINSTIVSNVNFGITGDSVGNEIDFMVFNNLDGTYTIQLWYPAPGSNYPSGEGIIGYPSSLPSPTIQNISITPIIDYKYIPIGTTPTGTTPNTQVIGAVFNESYTINFSTP